MKYSATRNQAGIQSAESGRLLETVQPLRHQIEGGANTHMQSHQQKKSAQLRALLWR